MVATHFEAVSRFGVVKGIPPLSQKSLSSKSSGIALEKPYLFPIKEKAKKRSGTMKALTRDSVDRQSWLAFIDLYLEMPEHQTDRLTFDGWHVSESDRRALARWQKEGATPRIWKADAFLVRHGMNLREYEVWCEHEGRKALAFPELEEQCLLKAELEAAGAAR